MSDSNWNKQGHVASWTLRIDRDRFQFVAQRPEWRFEKKELVYVIRKDVQKQFEGCIGDECATDG